MANGAGFYLQLPDEPTIYISGDTVYTNDVERALTEYMPDIANHLEALNHCPTTRLQLKQTLEKKDLLSNVFIPDDGETLIFDKDNVARIVA